MLGVDVHFQQHIKNFCILLLDVDLGLQNTGSVAALCATDCIFLFWGVHHDPRSDGLRLKHENNTKPMGLTG